MYNVLIVDDEPVIRNGLRQILNWEELGFTIKGDASDGLEALKFLELNKNIDVIITDIKMENKSGLDLIQEVYQEYRNIYCIIISGYDDFEYARKALKFKVSNYLLKPVDAADLTGVIESIKNEIHQVRGSSGSELFSHNYLLEKIKNGIYKEEEIQKYISDFNLENNEFYQFLLLEVDDINCMNNNLTWTEKKNKICKIDFVLNNFFLNDIKYVVEKESLSLYGIIIPSSILKHYSNRLWKFLSRLKYKITENTNIKVSFFVGKEVPSLHMLFESYQSAIICRNHRFYRDFNSTIIYNEIKDKSFKMEYQEILYFKKLKDSIIHNDLNGIVSSLDRIEQEIEENYIELSLVQIYINNFIAEVIKEFSLFQVELDKSLDLILVTKKDYMDITLGKLFYYLKQFCLNAAGSFKIKKRSSGIISVIEDYIVEHYKERISLIDIAEKYKINPAYLGQQFKKKMSISFNDFLNKIRLEKAIILLENSEKKIYEIAYDVGYTDPNYFSMKFEKFYDVPPGKYRKLRQ